jgi:trk system potassium uptake protein TrkH
MLLAARGLGVVAAGFVLLTITELAIAGSPFGFRELLFETFSAFGTVGLSMGVTAGLSGAGKVVVMLTMFAGRVGIISLALPRPGRQWRKLIDYPTGEVLIG